MTLRETESWNSKARNDTVVLWIAFQEAERSYTGFQSTPFGAQGKNQSHRCEFLI
jgi:hypothetical protein